MREARTDIHGILRLEASGEDSLVRCVERELEGHLVSEKFSDEPGLSVRFGPFDAPSGSGLFIDKNIIFAQESYKGARWRVKMEGMEGDRLKMFFQGNALSRMIVVKRVIEPALRYLMDIRGYPMVHSACLVRDGQGVLAAAKGGGGKTTLLLNWLEDGNPFFSDDFTIVSQEKLFSYITPLRLGFRNLIESPSLGKLPFKDKLEIVFRTLARHILLKKVRLAYKAGAKKIFPGARVFSGAKLHAVILIRSRSGRFSMTGISPKETAGELAAIDREEMYRFPSYLSAYAEKFPDSPASGFFEAHREKLESALKNIPCFELHMPDRWDENDWNKFKDTLFPL
jgi:hypothetical protein